MKTTQKTRKTTLVGRGWGIVVAVFILCILTGNPGQAMAGNDDEGSENLIRSAMVFNFCKFVQWPETDQDTLVLGVMVNPNKATDFSSIEGKEVHDSYINVKPVHSAEDLAGCQLVFIPKDMENHLENTFATAQTESVLTISEIDGFCSQGGMIQLVERRGKLRFFINNKAAGESHLILSSQLLKMAKIVEGS